MRRTSEIIASMYDAATAPELWPTVLQSVAEAANAVGAAYIIRDRSNGAAEWASFVGPSAGFRSDYVGYYSARDSYSPLLQAAPAGTWLRLSTCRSRRTLEEDEWYNDFVLRCGVQDIYGSQLAVAGERSAVFGIHYGTIRNARGTERRQRLRQLRQALSSAAKLDCELRQLGWERSVASQALDHLAGGVIVVHADRKVVELNRVAESILARNDGLAISRGRLRASRGFETERLQKFVEVAAERRAAELMLVARSNGGHPYVLMIAPVGAAFDTFGAPQVMVLVTDPDQALPSEPDLIDLFGLSPAEARLATGLLAGRKLVEIAGASGVRISTLRTQLSSALHKVGVARQADLLRVLARVKVTRLGPR